MANKEKLFTEFTAPTKQEWLDKIEVDLKGADFQKRLVWITNDAPALAYFLKNDVDRIWFEQHPEALTMYSELDD